MTTYDFDTILNTTHLVPFSEYYRIQDFDCGITEYNAFLVDSAKVFQERGVTNTQLLIDNTTGDVIGYIALCMSSIKLSDGERNGCHLADVHFKSIPALKLGKLAIDHKYTGKMKGYGSYLIQIVRGIAADMNNNGIACRFILVDADIQYNAKAPEFYSKNLFVANESIKKNATTISMRLDIYGDVEPVVQEQVG